MAKIELHPALPVNIVELALDETERLQDCYEKGFLIVLRGAGLRADFEFLSGIRDPAPNNNRRKYFLTHPDHVHRERQRDAPWGHFRDEVFPGDGAGYERFRREVRGVNQQLLDIADRAFPAYRYKTCPIAWKFQDLPQGENLHIDNLDGCEKLARMRIFANLATTTRSWAIGAHLREYALQCFDSAHLQQHLASPLRFNHSLTVAAFGDNNTHVGDRYPLHRLEFAPGDVWMLNSAVTAHQVLHGKLLALTTFAFPYRCYRNKRETLPRVISEIGRAKLGSFRYATQMLRQRLRAVLPRRSSPPCPRSS